MRNNRTFVIHHKRADGAMSIHESPICENIHRLRNMVTDRDRARCEQMLAEKREALPAFG